MTNIACIVILLCVSKKILVGGCNGYAFSLSALILHPAFDLESTVICMHSNYKGSSGGLHTTYILNCIVILYSTRNTSSGIPTTVLWR